MSPVQDGSEADDLASMKTMLDLFDAIPDILPIMVKLRYTTLAEAINMRVCNEEHPCIRCGLPATEAFIARLAADAGHRWLDLCGRCSWLMSRVVDELTT